MTSSATSTDQVASGPDLLYRLTYADPTGEAAVRKVLEVSRGDVFTLVDSQGNPVFLIRRDTLTACVIPHFQFTRTRRGKDNLMAHCRKHHQ